MNSGYGFKNKNLNNKLDDVYQKVKIIFSNINKSHFLLTRLINFGELTHDYLNMMTLYKNNHSIRHIKIFGHMSTLMQVLIWI